MRDGTTRSFSGSSSGSGSMGNGSALGSSLWEWDGSKWELREDHTREGGEPRKPTQPGAFAGQFRSIASRESDK